jgi:hypothetical protein
MATKVLNILTSLRLTVLCLALALGLVFIGTLAQVKYGLYIVQHDFFGSFIVWWKGENGSWKIPVYPGGYLLGVVLLANLIAAHLKRFELSKKKFGIFVIHLGLILLLVGQLFTQLFQVESFMRIEEGSARNYSESGRYAELAVIDKTDPETDFVVAIPQSVLAHKKVITTKDLPFKLKVDEFFENSNPKLTADGELKYANEKLATAMEERNIPAATVEIVTDEGSKGSFEVSNWATEDQLIGSLMKNFGRDLKPSSIEAPQFTYKGHTYEVVMRPMRFYKPYTLALKDFTHDRYPGTDIPKDFSSRVQLINPEKQEDREVRIFMNNPLRYGGETYYQGGFEPGDTVSILQVVRNPGWITPYVACLMVGAGLLVQFLSHLIKFSRKRAAA